MPLISQTEFLAKLNALDVHDGYLSDIDALALVDVAKKASKPNCMFLEIGSWKGKSTICLATVAAKTNGKVVTIDHFQGGPGTKEVGTSQYIDVFSIFKTNMTLVKAWQSLVFLIMAPFEVILPILKNEYFDLIYVDADNRYESMKNILSQSVLKIKRGGIICGRNLTHQYTEVAEQVDHDIDQEYSTRYRLHPGIIKAVHNVFGSKITRVDNTSVWYFIKKR